MFETSSATYVARFVSW